MDKKIEKHSLYIFFSALVLLQVFFILFNTGTYGGADNITHFQTARYSINHPKLLLDLWGKPIYTTLLTPFTILGFKVAKGFNLIVAILSLMIVYKYTISKGFSVIPSVFVLILTAFAPVYFLLMNSCLTEILFSFILVSSVYLFYKNQYLLSVVLISFIPFVRTEGYVLFPVFAVAIILRRQFKPILFLFTGTVLYSFIGFLVFDDPFWLINKMPYSMGDSIYGSGSLFHFVKSSHFIFGIPFLLFLVTGLFVWTIEIFRSRSFNPVNISFYIVVVGSWLGYFAAHSYVWWKGTGGSLGLTRVIGAIIPVAAITCVEGIGFLDRNLKSKRLYNSILIVFGGLQIFLLFTQNRVLIKADPTEQLIMKCADYIRFNHEKKKFFYFNPVLTHELNIDPYDINQCNWGVGDKQQPSNSMNWGDLLVWDAHFGPNEGGVQLETLEIDPNLQKIKSFYPLEKVTVLGGYDYSVQLFKKSAMKNDSIVLSDNYQKTLSFEGYKDERVREVDGFKAWELDNSQEYSPTIRLTPNVLQLYETLEVEVTLDYKSFQKLSTEEVLLVFSVDKEGINLRYENVDLVSSGGGWEELKLNVKMSTRIPSSSKMQVYVWNKDRKHLLMRCLKVCLKSY
ncbi:hypothetical protein [Sunxiuqinia indica]|uniref:hypothetical protein n=1 Tax=Sunxiuqinia indica TaxID=2692584 RepID=UPI00135C3682|nr:hypothetical protein [Sunxiuqinia indica]